MKYTMLIFLYLFHLRIVSAQDFTLEKISTREGLSQNDVNCILQDRNGFLWIGTNDGLNRYDGYNFKTYHLHSANGDNSDLSSGLIYRIKEDKKGVLWIATSNEGICKFDVEKEIFTPIRNTPDNPKLITDNRVLDLECMDDGTVWISTRRGINIISETNDSIHVKQLSVGSIQEDNNVCYSISQDQFRNVWFEIANHLFSYTPEGELHELEQMSGMVIRDILAIPDGILFGTHQGIYFMTGQTQAQYELTKFSDLQAKHLLFDKNQNLYVATNQGLYVFNYEASKKQPFSQTTHIQNGPSPTKLNSPICNCIYEDYSGIIWIGTYGGGLNKYNPKRKKFNHYKSTGLKGSLSHNKIRAIFEDSEYNIWIGTEGGGTNFLDHRHNRNFNTGFLDLSVNANLLQNNSSYRNRSSYTQSFIENNIYSFIEVNTNGSKKIWAGAGYPFKLIELGLATSPHPVLKLDVMPELQQAVFSTIKDRDGNIWLGTYGSAGLYKYEKTENGYRVRNYTSDGKPGQISSNIIRSLLQDRRGNMWIGTDDGLCVLPSDQLNRDNPNFKVFRHNPDDITSLSNNYILPIFETNAGDIWVGTMGGGLNHVMHPENLDSVSFACFNTSTGLPNNVIKGILEDDSANLWVSSNKGLTRFSPTKQTVMNYDVSDGLQDFEFGELACCKLHDGMMVFGGVNGFNTFYPHDIVGDNSLPKVVFTELQVLNQTVKPGQEIQNHVILDKVINHTDKITLKYSENSFAIYFSALHFSAPNKNKYKYRLEGFDSNWIQKNANERFAKYTNLRPNTYKFQLLASNNDGVWSETLRQIEIEIIPPWWQSKLAFFVYFCLFACILWFFQRYSIIQINQKNELILEHFEKEKTKELSQMKLQFFTNISHEFRTPLTIIIGLIDKLIKINHKLPEEYQRKLPVIQRNAGVLLRLINQLIDFRRFENGKMQLAVNEANIVSFLTGIVDSFRELALSQEIEYTFNPPEKDIYLWFDEEKIERIIYNLISNAFKFTLKGGKVDIQLVEHPNHVAIRIIDTGIGIPDNVKQHIFERFYRVPITNHPDLKGTGAGIGLSFSKGLANLHKGDITFQSKEGEGSCFELMLKKGKSHFSADDLLMHQKGGVTENHARPIEISTMNPQNYALHKSSRRNKAKILIIEDNLELRLFLQESFTDYQVLVSANGEDGFLMALKHDPELIISDIMMPIKNGFELCHDIKNNIHLSHIPVILLTAKTSSNDMIYGFENGADAYVAKPFQLDVLMAQVKTLIKIRHNLKVKFNKSIEVIPSEVTSTSMDEKFMKRILEIVEKNISNPDFTVDQLAGQYGITSVNLNKKLKSLTGLTTTLFIRDIRLKRAAQLLSTGKYLVADITYEVGFQDLKHFRTIFKAKFGLTPSQYVKKGRQKHTPLSD